MKLQATLLAGVASFAVASAAQAGEGYYGAVGAGLTYIHPDRDFESDLTGFDGEADYDPGIGIYVALGKYLDQNEDYRAELEYSYRRSDLRHVDIDTPGFPSFGASENVDGELASHSIFANLIRDFDVTGVDGLVPYLGGGVGISFVDVQAAGVSGPASLAIDEDRTAFAYQGIAGVAYELAENLAFDLSYRYMGNAKEAYSGAYSGVNTEVNTSTDSHNIFAGLRWSFGAAAATEYKDCWDGSSVPVSAECPPQLVETQAAVADPANVIVYFDYNKSNLTPEAANLIREFAASALQNDIDTVVVAGNTDTSGSSAYNQALSERRAQAVVSALVANGIPADAIQSQALGETNLAKPTPDGTREPLNRRAEVTISFQ